MDITNDDFSEHDFFLMEGLIDQHGTDGLMFLALATLTTRLEESPRKMALGIMQASLDELKAL